MSAPTSSDPARPAHEVALETLAQSAASNVPGADFVSITVRTSDQQLHTMAATHPVAEQADRLQYELLEGPCYVAVTEERLVLVNDMAASTQFPRYGPKAVELGIGAQAGVHLVENGERAGLNLYSRTRGAFDRSTVQFAELFATHAGALLGYAKQVEQLSEALHTRSDIGTAMGILMERYGITNDEAFGVLVRSSSRRNIKLRILAQLVIDGTLERTTPEDPDSCKSP